MRKFIVASVILLLLTNFVVLAGVAYNRSGSPIVSIELTERELPILKYRSSNDENSGTTLLLKWEILNPDEDSEYFYKAYGTPAWLDDEKLVELGFEMANLKRDSDKYKHKTGHLGSEVILALEYDGDAYKKALSVAKKRVEQVRQKVDDSPDDSDLVKKLERYEKQLSRLEVSQTRLYVVDASLNEQDLIQKYTGKKNYLFSRGEVGLRWDDDVVSGRIKQLFIKQVHAPLPLSNQLETLTNGEKYPTYEDFIHPRYRVQLNIGQRLEPWLASVTQ